MRLIDADKALENLKYDSAIAALMKTYIEIQPTAYEVKRGYWIDSQGKFSACSNCGVVNNDSINRTKYFMPYCFRCGAKMDEKEVT